jgi:uncharacterized membrane protein YfcA
MSAIGPKQTWASAPYITFNDPQGGRLGSQVRLQKRMPSAIRCPYFQKAFGWCVPIGGLAGLVGLGGGEFRLPVLMYGVGYPARTAVPLNLAVSLITLTFALVVRSRAVSIAALGFTRHPQLASAQRKAAVGDTPSPDTPCRPAK